MENYGAENPALDAQSGGHGDPGEEGSSRSRNLQESLRLPELSPPADHLLFSLVATVLFLPLGIAAILQTVKSRKALAMSDLRTAHYASQEALRYSLAAVFLGSNIAVAVVTVVLCTIYQTV